MHRYRLAPPYHFPVPFEDVYRVVKYFLQLDVLARYKVDPERVAVSGDSAGGNLAAAVSQQVRDIRMSQSCIYESRGTETRITIPNLTSSLVYYLWGFASVLSVGSWLPSTSHLHPGRWTGLGVNALTHVEQKW